MTNYSQKTHITHFTRAEYLNFVDMIGQDLASTEEESDKWLLHWDRINPHPLKSDLMYWPADGQAKTTEEIIVEIERYCRENGLPCFKDSDF